jgi:hypothetical protein
MSAATGSASTAAPDGDAMVAGAVPRTSRATMARQVNSSSTASAIPGTTAHINSTAAFARGRSGRTAGSRRAASTERTIDTCATRQQATESQKTISASEWGTMDGWM